MTWRAHAERDRIGLRVQVFLGHLAGNDLQALQATVTSTRIEEGVMSPAYAVMDEGAARALYEALDQVFNGDVPDRQFATKVLEREQERVDKLIEAVIS